MEETTHKIAILRCRRSIDRCTGAGCLRAFFDRTKHFQQYAGQEVRLMGFFDCNGCEADKMEDPGLNKKLKRMQELEVEKIHLSSCAVSKCENIAALEQAVQIYGFEIEKGTHHEKKVQL